MLYVAYLPKKAKEPLKNRLLNNAIKNYYSCTGCKDSIIASPGYLSYKTNTIDNFLKEFAKLSTFGNKLNFGIFVGMNGMQTVRGTKNDILKEHNRAMPHYNFIPIKFHVKANKDHRKVICFCYINPSFNAQSHVINKNNIDLFMSNVRVNAAIIGSSNLSDKTYFADPSDKGEADVFLINDTVINESDVNLIFRSDNDNNSDDNNNGSMFVVAKSFYGYGNKYSQEFLNDILKEMLLINLG